MNINYKMELQRLHHGSLIAAIDWALICIIIIRCPFLACERLFSTNLSNFNASNWLEKLIIPWEYWRGNSMRCDSWWGFASFPIQIHEKKRKLFINSRNFYIFRIYISKFPFFKLKSSWGTLLGALSLYISFHFPSFKELKILFSAWTLLKQIPVIFIYAWLRFVRKRVNSNFPFSYARMLHEYFFNFNIS